MPSLNHSPSQSEIDRLLNQAAQLGQSGRLSEAADLCRQILQDHPDSAQAWHFLGLAALQQGQPQAAISHLDRAIDLAPNIAEFHNHAGVANFSVGNFEAGIKRYQQALELQPQSIDARYNLALGMQKLDRLDRAIELYREIISQQPRHAQAHYSLGNALQQNYQFQAAIEHYQKSIAIQPNYAEAWYNLGVAWQTQADYGQAIAAYEQAIALNPRYVEAHNGIGAILELQGKGQAAIDCYKQALEINPSHIHAWLNLANVQQRLGDLNVSIESYRQVLAIAPDHPKALDGLIGLLRQTGQWSELDVLTQRLWQSIESRIGQNLNCEVSPLNSLYLPFTAAQQQSIAVNHAQSIERKVTELQDRFSFEPNARRNEKIRLGYVSGDFRNHAVAHLMLRLFELHDRTSFEVFAYSLGPDDGSAYRQKLMTDCDCWREMHGLTPASIVTQMRTDRIDISIDLAGYTEHAIPEIFALRAAPIQINYLGYPGTLGAEYIDYVITDAVITPPELVRSISEKCLLMPDSYQINYDWQPLSTHNHPKSTWGLPEDSAIYCCFNKAQKIEPTIFAAWMRILKQVPHSVLWLLQDHVEFETHLRAAATSHGVNSKRLIFAPRQSRDIHLQRHQSADLFLDTLYYNAHTSASDSLRVGVPLLTVLGETFAGRVAASLLSAVGLPELIAPDLSAYEQIAIELGQNPAKLQQLKQKLLAQLPTTSLFDPSRFVRNLEANYDRVWQAGHQPDLPTHQPATRTPDLTDSNLAKTITCSIDNGFQSWLSQAGGSLAITTYQAGKIAIVGWDGSQVSLLMREFTKPMGIAVDGQRLALATKHEVILFANAPMLAHHFLEDRPGRYDALYLPRTAYFTGDLNVHDLAFADDRLWMVNTRFSCLSQLSSDFSFEPRWQPSFISELAPEDRCHLNGLSIVNGKPKFVTALGESNEVGGWRANKATGGIAIDVDRNEIIVRGLSMPHSPVWYRNCLWVLNSGTGELWCIDPETGKHDVVCALPGFLRGLCFVGDYAVIGLCQMRETNIFGGLPIQTRFDRLLCGVAVVDLRTGDRVGMLEFTAGCEELYGVQFLPNISRPNILNAQDEAIRDAFTAPEFAYWLRPSFLV